MKYLLDTCVLLWFLQDNKKRLGPFHDWIENAENDVAISVVNYWEIVIKSSLGKLIMPKDWFHAIDEAGFTWLNLEKKHIKQLETLPALHNDPFDRLLICQAQVEQRKLLSKDAQISRYNISGL